MQNNMDNNKAQIRVYPCPSVVKKIQAPPSLTHYRLSRLFCIGD
jgi:hypothetical protein